MTDTMLGVLLGACYVVVAIGYGGYMLRILLDGDHELTERDISNLCLCAMAWPVSLPLWLWTMRR